LYELSGKLDGIGWIRGKSKWRNRGPGLRVVIKW
jgi:hypothetical protein